MNWSFKRIRAAALIVAATLCLAAASMPCAAQAGPQKPITKQGLIEALRIGGLSLQELIEYVRARGVDFQVTPEVEAELRAAAAQRELIEAVRASYRGAGPAPAAAPLTQREVATLLQVGTPSARVAQLVEARGVSFALTPEAEAELRAAGATPELLAVVARRALPAPAPAAEIGPPAAPVMAPPAAAAPPAGASGPAPQPNIKELAQVHKIFVSKMEHDLDQYIRAEIGKQMKGRLTIVLTKDEADAIMDGAGEYRTGTGAQITGRYLGLHDNASAAVTVTDRTGTVVLWAGEAGDRSLLFGAMKRGGPRKVAERIVSNLKKALK